MDWLIDPAYGKDIRINGLCNLIQNKLEQGLKNKFSVTNYYNKKMNKCKVIAVANQKDGIGKTATTFHLGGEGLPIEG